jgi:hypothetical protein
MKLQVQFILVLAKEAENVVNVDLWLIIKARNQGPDFSIHKFN